MSSQETEGSDSVIDLVRKHNPEMIRICEQGLLNSLQRFDESLGLNVSMVHLERDINDKLVAVRISIHAPRGNG